MFDSNDRKTTRADVAMELLAIARGRLCTETVVDGLGISFDKKAKPGSTIHFCASKKVADENSTKLEEISKDLSKGVVLTPRMGTGDMKDQNKFLIRGITAKWDLLFSIDGKLKIISARTATQEGNSIGAVKVHWQIENHWETPPPPRWLLIEAFIDTRFGTPDIKSPPWFPPKKAWKEHEEPDYNYIRKRIKDVLSPLCDAFQLIKWHNDIKAEKRRSWNVSLKKAPDTDDDAGIYQINEGQTEGWRRGGQQLQINHGKRTRQIDVWWDETADIWKMRGPKGLSGTCSISEPEDDALQRQRNLTLRLADGHKFNPADLTAIATQIPIHEDDQSHIEHHMYELPGESQWEERQAEAIKLAMAKYPIVAIKGPPGTGKSTVIVGLVRRFVASGEKVLLVAPTHVAVDEVLRRIDFLRNKLLDKTVLPVRIPPRDEGRVDQDLLKYTVDRWAATLRNDSVRYLNHLLGDNTQRDGRLRQLTEMRAAISQVEPIEQAKNTEGLLRAKIKDIKKDLHEMAGKLKSLKKDVNSAAHQTALTQEKAERLKPSGIVAHIKDFFSGEYNTAQHSAKSAAAKETKKRNELHSLESNEIKLVQELEYSRNEERLIAERILSLREKVDETYKEQTDELLKNLDSLKTHASHLELELGAQGRKITWASRWKDFFSTDEGSDDLSQWIISSANLIATTTQGIASNPHFRNNCFDVVICDESSRVTRGEILVPSLSAKRIILVGDEHQLPPYVETEDEMLIQALAVLDEAGEKGDIQNIANDLANRWNLDEPELRPFRVKEVSQLASQLKASVNSLPMILKSAPEHGPLRRTAWRKISDALTGSCFDHALSFIPKKQIIRLDIQRRMPDDNAALVRDPVYNGDYRTPATGVEGLTTPKLCHSWMFIDTSKHQRTNKDYRERLEGSGFVNHGEACLVKEVLLHHAEHARRSNRPPPSFMVISFYLAQSRLITSLLDRLPKEKRNIIGHNLSILPIDRCQGQEADVVVISFSRTRPNPQIGTGLWLQDPRRLNVAITRARRSLVMIGCCDTLWALRGNTEGERILNHLQISVEKAIDHRIFTLSEV